MGKDERWRNNKGVYFGWSTKHGIGDPPPRSTNNLIRYVGDRHLMTIGPNGSGKSRRLLLPNLHDLTEWSVLVVDPKGDLAVMTEEHRRKAKNTIVRLNPFGALGLKSDGFNPLTTLERSDEFPDDAMGLAEALIRVEGKEPHFSQTAQDLIGALIMYVKLVLRDPSLVDVRRMLSQKTGALRDMITEDFVRYRGTPIYGMLKAAEKFDCPALDSKAARFADIGPENRELSSVISTALTQTRWLDSIPIQADIAKGAFDFSKMKEEPWTVYLILPARRMATHSTWLRLMITSVMQPLMRGTEEAPVPVLLMLDEFAQLGHLPAIEQNLGLMRGYGLKLWAVLQDLSQLKYIYGERWESFASNAGVFQSFASRDVFTTRQISALTNGTASSRELNNMEEGFGVLLTHKVPGTVFHYVPYPDELDYMKPLCALDPSKNTRRN